MAIKTAGLGGLACVLALLSASSPPVLAADVEVSPTVVVDTVDTVALMVDFAEVVRLQRPATTIVIGNPGIADATLGDEHSLILTGRAAGTTNLIVLDAAGNEIAGLVLHVLAGPRRVTTFFHGTSRRTYRCDQRCEAVLSVGDDTSHFSATQNQIEARQQFSTPPAAR